VKEITEGDLAELPFEGSIAAIKVQFFKLQKPTVSKQYCQILFEKGVRS
jgi:hypothetical protein